MTARLVGLIALILLSSLLASWLLISHYQERSMDELARTVSAVGEATLRSVEPAAVAEAGPAGPAELVIVDASDGRTVIELDGAAIVSDSAQDEPALYVRPSGVHAAREPGRGLVLRIPAFERGVEAPAHRAGDIVLPVPTRDHAALFRGLRRSSLVASVGVFVVGLLLAVVLSVRLTRPIRQLDDGFRRLSGGDLSAEIPVCGTGEAARLGRAFNTMLGKLRSAREREREMMRRDRMASLGRLAAGVAHDVRNPLHSIGLTLAHLRESARPEDDGRAREFDEGMGLIGGEIRRLDRLVDDFLRFARTGRRREAEVDLGELLEQTSRLVAKDAGRRRIAMRLDVAAGVPRIPVHAESIRSAILNLVLNSFEAMPGGGTLSMSVRPRGAEVVLQVSDSGCGIRPQDQERVFDFAYSGRDGGSGMGLAMVHHVVVEEHGGRVALQSELGNGTSVEISLPVGARAAAEPPVVA